jgi:hypothetical protein
MFFISRKALIFFLLFAVDSNEFRAFRIHFTQIQHFDGMHVCTKQSISAALNMRGQRRSRHVSKKLMRRNKFPSVLALDSVMVVEEG